MNKPFLVLLSFAIGLLIFPAAVLLYLSIGQLPVAVADTPFPFEAKIVKVPLHARISREMPAKSLLEGNDANIVAGAQIYRQQCASCHGLKDKPSSFGAYTFPKTPQLWSAHKNNPGVVGVSDDPVEETYWKIKNGIRLSGMPSYQKILSEEQMWQVSLLLSKAAGPLPGPAADLLVANRP